MAVTRITPWAVNGPAANYGLASSLAGTATNVPAGALIVTSVQAQTTTQPSVSDTAGNVYTVVKGGSKTSYLTTWIAYCLSAIANTANVVTWTTGSTVLSGAQGAAYTTSSGTWAFDKTVGGVSAYATALALSITSTGGGVLYGGFGEYYTGPDTWTVAGLASQASQAGSSSGNGTIGCLLADDIISSGVTGLSITVSDANGGYGGYIAGVVGSFVVNAGSSNALNAPISMNPAIAGTLQASQALQSSVQAPVGALGALAASVAMSCSATILPRTGAALAQRQTFDAAVTGGPLSLKGAGTLTQVLQAALAPSVSIGSSAQAFLNLQALVETAPRVVGTFTVTVPGQVNLNAAVAVSPSLVGTMTARQGFAGAVLLDPSFSGKVSLTQGAKTSVVLPPRMAGALSIVTPGVISLAGAITIQPGMGGYLQASQTSVGASTTAPGVVGQLTPVNQLRGAATLSPSVAGLWLSFLRMGSPVAAPFGMRGTAYAWQTLQGDVSVTPSVIGTIAPTFTGYPVDPNFYLAMPPRTFTVTLDGRVLYVAMPPRSFYLLDDDTMAAQTFPALFDPAESDTVTFDKTQDLIAGETLVSLEGALEVSVLIGIDPTPGSHFGTPAINPLVLPAQPPRQPVQIAAGCGLQIPVLNTVVDGCSYLIRQPCATSLGRVMVVKGILKVSSQ